ncbi:MAG: flippase-like domain-containing protein [Halobacteriales archaeon]
MADGTEVSVVLPAYDEEDTLETTVGETLDALAGFLPAGRFEVVIAEDGCTDRTPDIAARLADEDDRVQHLHSADRLGRGKALEQAFELADGDVVAYLDTDMATDMRHLKELIETVRTGEADVVTGSRWVPGHEADRPMNRSIPSRGFNTLTRLVLRSTLRDHQCGFKAFDREALLAILEDVEDEHWFWDTEVLVRAQRAGCDVHEFPVEWTPKGDTKVDLVRDVFGMGSQIVRTWWQLSVQPRITRRRSITAGLVLSLLAIALMGVYLPVGDILDHIGDADPILVSVAAIVYLVSWPLRGARYRDILSELGFHERVDFLTGAVFISQTGNLVAPARLGDGVRAYVVKTRRAVPYPTGFASLAVERVFDLLTIAALAGAVLLGLVATGSELSVGGAAGSDVARSGRTAIVVAAGVGVAAILAVAAIVVSARSEHNRIRPFVERFSDDSYVGYVAGVIEQFVGDVQTVAADRGSFLRVGANSLLIWTLDVLTAFLVFRAFPGASEVGPEFLLGVCFFAVSVGNLAKVLPLSPGGIGLYEGAFTLLIVTVTPLGPALALGAAIVDHAVKNVVTIAGGVVSMLWLNVSLTTAVEEARETAPTEAD